MMPAIRSVGIFGSHLPSSDHGKAAKQIMKALQDAGVNKIIYGGSGIGTGGEIAKAALEQGIENIEGVYTAEIAAKYPRSPFLTKSYIVEGYGAEKDIFRANCDSILALAGGGGTTAEITAMWEQNFVTMLSSMDTNREALSVKLIPILLLNLEAKYWEDFRTLVINKIKTGFAPIHHLELFTFIDSLPELPLALSLWNHFLAMLTEDFLKQTNRTAYVVPLSDARRGQILDAQFYIPSEFKRDRGFIERFLKRPNSHTVMGLQSLKND